MIIQDVRKRITSPKNKKIATNTLMLYLLFFSSYTLAFITIPYQTRILGPELFGIVGLATTVMIFIQLFIDFGFLIYATAEVSRNRSDIDTINRLFSGITFAKLLFSAMSLFLLMIGAVLFENIAKYWLLYLLSMLSGVTASLLPDFLYKGMEKMTPIAVRVILLKLFSVLSIFVLLRSANDYLVIPALSLIGNTFALILVYRDISKRFYVNFIRVPYSYVKNTIRVASPFFYSRIASAVYGAGNTIILGSQSPGIAVGYYFTADKLINTLKNGMSPIADSVYPHMINQKDYRLIKKILLLLMPLVVLFSIVLYIHAESICALIFGSEFTDVAPILRILIPIVAFTLPSYLLGFPTLGAMGLSRHANNSVMFAAVAQVIMITVLILTNSVTATKIAFTATASEGIVLAYRILIVYLNRNLLALK